MYEIGLDFSIASTGLTILKDGGMVHTEIIKTKKSEPCLYADANKRGHIVANRVKELTQEYYPCRLTIEGLSFGSKGNATRSIPMAFSLVYEAVKHLDVVFVPPSTLKLFVTGKGNASKDMMEQSLKGYDIAAYNQILTKGKKIDDLIDAYFLANWRHKLGTN